MINFKKLIEDKLEMLIELVEDNAINLNDSGSLKLYPMENLEAFNIHDMWFEFVFISKGGGYQVLEVYQNIEDTEAEVLLDRFVFTLESDFFDELADKIYKLLKAYIQELKQSIDELDLGDEK